MVIMSKRKVKKCPQCSCSINSSVSRLIRDTCGHKKCRLCLLKEEKGCLACAVKEDSDDQETENGENPDSPEAFAVNSDASSDVNTLDNNSSGTNIVIPSKVIQENIVTDKVRNTSKIVKRKKFSLESHIVVVPGTPQKYRCTICNKECSSKHTVRYHNYCGSENKPFKCETCGKGFVTKAHYEYHTKTHTGLLPYICTVCGKGFKQKGKLTRHSTQHSGDRPFVCQECGKTFGNIESLKSHQRVHKGEKPHVCQLCSKSFIEFSNYKKHVSSVHRGEKVHMCDTCGKTFAIKRTLTIHISMVHDHERNHICKICNKPFSLKRDLKRHEVVHSVVRPHSCTLCGIGFRRKDNFERHMKNTHPETRMVIVGTIKPKSSASKPPSRKQLRREEKTGDSDEICEKDIPSPIPPSQTIDEKTLNSIPKISDEKKKSNEARETISSGANQSGQISGSSCLETVNYCSATPETCLTQESLPVPLQEQCYENINNIHKTTDGSITPYIVHQEQNQDGAPIIPTIYPPKKNVEYYREFSVINRSSNAMNSCNIESDCQTMNTSDQQEIVKRVEGTNCVPTITRASEYVSGSVITRNVQQTCSTVLKPLPRHDSYQAMDSVPCLETHVDQPSLRKLLHDVKCSDGSDILNLTSDVNMNKRALFTEDFRQLDDMRFYKQNNVEEQFYSHKYPDTYVPEPSLRNTVNEYTSNSDGQYLSHDYSRKIPSQNLFPDTQCRQNYTQSLNYDFIPPSYMEYGNDTGQDLSQYSNAVQSSELGSRYSTDLNKSCVDNYMYSAKHFDSGSRLKLLADIPQAEEGSCTQAVGQPVIVGTKKISNNVICSSFNS